jgi:hypothetical protein
MHACRCKRKSPLLRKQKATTRAVVRPAFACDPVNRQNKGTTMLWPRLTESLKPLVENKRLAWIQRKHPTAEYGFQQRKRTSKTPLYRNIFFILHLSLRLAFEILAIFPWGSPGCFDGMKRALLIDGRARNRKRRTERWYNSIFGI